MRPGSHGQPFEVVKLRSMVQHLPDIVHGKPFVDTLTRFIPMPVQERTLQQPKFLDFLTSQTQALLGKAEQLLEGEGPGAEFQI